MKNQEYQKLLRKANDLQAAADELLKLVRLHNPTKRLSVRAIQDTVAAEFNVNFSVMRSRLRGPESDCVARMVAMFLTRELLGISLMQIGAQFGHRDHGTVLNACEVVSNRMETERESFGVKVSAVRAFLEAKIH